MTSNALVVTKRDVPFYDRPPMIWLWLSAAPVSLIGVFMKPGFAVLFRPVSGNAFAQVALAVAVGATVGIFHSWLYVLYFSNGVVSKKESHVEETEMLISVHGVKMGTLLLGRMVVLFGGLYLFYLAMFLIGKVTNFSFSSLFFMQSLWLFHWLFVFLWYRRLSN
ncbi:MAG: hypothetical protein ABFD49_04725 [Armatimonadota bacterium]|nr:hypothetical protein [bacterium]